jgi:hypothetical protein
MGASKQQPSRQKGIPFRERNGPPQSPSARGHFPAPACSSRRTPHRQNASLRPGASLVLGQLSTRRPSKFGTWIGRPAPLGPARATDNLPRRCNQCSSRKVHEIWLHSLHGCTCAPNPKANKPLQSAWAISNLHLHSAHPISDSSNHARLMQHVSGVSSLVLHKQTRAQRHAQQKHK